MKLMIIEALDHFSTNNREYDECIARISGELIDENEKYYIIRHFKGDILDQNTFEELHYILKAVIVRKQEIEINDWKEIKNESICNHEDK